jgi:Secretion system C-terminal sorting domain
MNIKSGLFLTILSCVFIFISSMSFAASRYWVGSGAGNWNSTTNWSNSTGGLSGFSVPGVSDTAFFDGANLFNCVINANISVSGVSIASSYSGTISVNPGFTITVAADGFSQAGGTFTGSTGSITINGHLNLTGGTFTSTSGILQIAKGYSNVAGTFIHNNGTVDFSTTQTITGSTVFYDLMFVANGGIYTISPGTIITSNDNLIISGNSSYTINTGIVEIKGNLTLTSSSNHPNNGGTTTFLFNGTGVQNINSAIATILIGTNEKIVALPNVEINKISGSLNLFGIINLLGTSWLTTAGSSLVNPGTSTVNINSNITFSGQNLTLYNIHITPSGNIITLSPATFTLTSTHNVTINGGSYYELNTGILEILGDLTLINTSTSAVNGGSGTFLFDGSGIQNINSSAVSTNFVCSLPNIVINKSAGSLNFSGIINFNGTSWNTISGSSLINAGTSTVNLLKNTTLSGQNISLYDIMVTGDFSTTTIVAGVTWTSTHLLTLAGGANWYQINTGTLNVKGDVLVTNTNTSNNVGGNAILLFDGTSNQLLTGSGIASAGRLPHVQINKSGGTLTFANPIISTDNSWTYIAGNVDATTNTSTIDFYRTAIIDGQGTSSTMSFYNVIFSGLISLGGNMDVKGDFMIATGVGNKLDVTVNNYQLQIAGNWANNNSSTATSFNEQNGTVIFDGTGAQTLSLDIVTNIESFHNLEMNNVGTGLTFNAPVSISANVNFIKGNIVSTALNHLLINNAATATGASNQSFVSGPVYKTGNQAFTFPVGKNALYAPISISAPAVNTNQFTAEYFKADPNPLYNVNNKDVSLDHISRCEYWILNRTVGASNVSVILSWDARSCGVTNPNDLRVARWDGASWRDHGNGGTTGTLIAGTVVSAAAVTAFSPFTMASISPSNALPISLVSFSGKCREGSTVLEWRTSSENNSAYFTLEQSTDAIVWMNLGTVTGAGFSSNPNNYSFAYIQPLGGNYYYRLRQTDFNGINKNVATIHVNGCNTGLAYNKLTIFPNPSTGIFNVFYSGKNDALGLVEIFDVLGKRLYFSDRFQSILDLSHIQSGTFYARFKLDNTSITKTIVIAQ